MSPSRTAVVGSALPLVVLLILAGIPTVRAAGLPGPGPGAPSRAADAAARTGAADADADEAVTVSRLRRSVQAGRTLAFTGTELVSAWYPGGSSTLLLGLRQWPGGVRTVTSRDGRPVGGEAARFRSVDGLGGLSARALTALAAEYRLGTAGADVVAGRRADVVLVSRNGREVARMWLDARTGLLLRQEVRDAAGRLQRTAAYVDLGPITSAAPAAQTSPGAAPTPATGVGAAAGTAVVAGTARAGRSGGAALGAELGPAELADLRDRGWPCPEALPGGFALLDARRGTPPAERDVVHLTYGDGLSAISVFLQPGRLDGRRLTGLTPGRWGDTPTYVRDGWPEVMVWQGGPTVITAVGDAAPGTLRTALAGLPRGDDSRLAAVQRRMRSAMGWFTR